MFHELPWRDREDGRATGQPQDVESEAYLNGTSQGTTPEDAREDGHIHGRSRRVMKHPGYGFFRKMESPGSTPARASAIPFLFYSTFEELSSFHIASLARLASKISTENWHSMDCSHCDFH